MFQVFVVVCSSIIICDINGMHENILLKDNSRALSYFQSEINYKQNMIYMHPIDDSPQKKFDDAMYIFNSDIRSYGKNFLEKIAVGVVESSLDGYTPAIDYLLYTCGVPRKNLIKEENKQYLVKKIFEKIGVNISAE